MKRVILSVALALTVVAMSFSSIGCGSGSPTKAAPTTTK